MVLLHDLFRQTPGPISLNRLAVVVFHFARNKVFEWYGLECHLCHTALIKNANRLTIYHRFVNKAMGVEGAMDMKVSCL